MTKEMEDALTADAEKLLTETGRDHANIGLFNPVSVGPVLTLGRWMDYWDAAVMAAVSEKCSGFSDFYGPRVEPPTEKPIKGVDSDNTGF